MKTGDIRKPHLFDTPINLLGKAKRCFVMVNGTEFYIKTTKQEIRELKKHLGGWHRFEFAELGDADGPDLYIDIRMEET